MTQMKFYAIGNDIIDDDGLLVKSCTEDENVAEEIKSLETNEAMILPDMIEKRIVTRGKKHCVVSEDGSKNLGCSSTLGGAKKRLVQVEYFKHKKSLGEDAVVTLLDEGKLEVNDSVLKSFVDDELEEVFKAKDDDAATFSDTGVETEDELAKRPRDIRGRNAGYSPDAERTAHITPNEAKAKYLEAKVLFAKHLPGKHDQKEHAGDVQQGLQSAPKTKADLAIMKVKTLKNLQKLAAVKGLPVKAKLRIQVAIKKLQEVDASGNNALSKEELAAVVPMFKEAWSASAQAKQSMGGLQKKFGKTEVAPKKTGLMSPTPTKGGTTSYYASGIKDVNTKIASLQSKMGALPKGGALSRRLIQRQLDALTAKKNYFNAKLRPSFKSLADYCDEVELIAKSILNIELPAYILVSDALVMFPELDAQTQTVLKSHADELVLTEDVLKHLPGKHNQQDHAGAKGSVGQVAHTPSQLKRAAAVQVAGDEGISVRQALKKVGAGHKVPTTKVPRRSDDLSSVMHELRDRPDLPSLSHSKKLLDSGVIGYRGGKFGVEHSNNLLTLGSGTKTMQTYLSSYSVVQGAAKEAIDKFGAERETKSLVEKADANCLKKIWGEYYKYYSGKYIAAGWQAYSKKNFQVAVQAFEKARDGFQPDKNPTEYKCLESWRADAESKVQTKSRTGIVLKFLPKAIETEWYITKASTDEKGVMRWQATTTKFSRDVQGDKVTKAFYEEAIRRFKSGEAPPAFFSVAHYGVDKECTGCNHVYKSYNEYECPKCGAERMIAGVTTDLYIQGDQPKAKGIFFPTTDGKLMHKAIRYDIKHNVPKDERVRISMGFFPDPLTGTVHKSHGRDFVAGWIEHQAGTRVPVVAETDITVPVEKSMLNIKTKQQDAASIVGEERAAEYDRREKARRLQKSGAEPQLIIKAKSGRKCECGAEVDDEDVDCPECGKMIGKNVRVEAEPEMAMSKHLPGKHDQADHAGSKGTSDELSDRTRSRRIKDWDSLKSKHPALANLSKKHGNAVAGDAFNIIKNGANGDEFFSKMKEKYGLDKNSTHEIWNDVFNAMIKNKSEIEETEAEIKHEVLYGHAHDEIGDDVDIVTGNEDEEDVGDAEDVEGEVEDSEENLDNENLDEGEYDEGELGGTEPKDEFQVDELSESDAPEEDDQERKHLPDKHDQASHGNGNLSNNTKASKGKIAIGKFDKKKWEGEEASVEEIIENEVSWSDADVQIGYNDNTGEIDEAKFVRGMSINIANNYDPGLSGKWTGTEYESSLRNLASQGMKWAIVATDRAPYYYASPDKVNWYKTDEIESFKSNAVDPLALEAAAALEEVTKALVAPGGNKQEMLAHAANLVSAIRDYAHTISGMPDTTGQPAEAVAATQDMNPAPQPGQKVGANQPAVPEEEVTERPTTDEAQEEEMESPEEEADETPADEQEEGRLHFMKQPTNAAQAEAKKPPMPVAQKKKPAVGPSMKARTRPDAVVKSAAEHPAEAYMLKWANTAARVIKSNEYTRIEKMELIQKSLNDLGPALVELVNDSTPIANSDVMSVVEQTVKSILAQRDTEHATQLATLEAKIQALTHQTVMNEVKSLRSQRPVRKSLANIRPEEAASNDGGIRKFSASEIARASTLSGGPRY